MNAEDLCGKVLGTCTLQKVIGRGGMGAVYLAQQTRPRRQVAVKVLMPISTLQPNQHKAFLERFRRETDAAASLEHPNIMPVHEYGELEGLAYLVMPYVSGGTLRDELEIEGRLPLLRIVLYLEQMAAALDHAHERGVIHRDIKPANILMTPEKRLLLTDFGLVKIITDTAPISNNPLSEAGMPMGTPDYMSPEQVVGKEIDPRADIYSLGVLLYHMVTGTVPFKGEMPMKVAVQHLHTPPPLPRSMRPDLPPAAEQVILRALAKRPEDRYMNAHDLASAFRLALEAAGVQLDNTMNGSSADERGGNRKRGLFDPVWRSTHQDASNPLPRGLSKPQRLAAFNNPANPAIATPSTAQIAPAPAIEERDKAAQRDIVAQTKMTLPSFSGILTDINLPAATAGQPAQGTESMRIRPGHKSLLEQRDAALEPVQSPAHYAAKTGRQRGQTPIPETPAEQAKALHAPLTPIPAIHDTSKQRIPFPAIHDTSKQRIPFPAIHDTSKQRIPFPSKNDALSLPQHDQREAATPPEQSDGKSKGPRQRFGIGHKTSLRSIKTLGRIAATPSTPKTQPAPPAQQQVETQQATFSSTLKPQGTEGTARPQQGNTGMLPSSGMTGALPPTGMTGSLYKTSALGDPNNPVGEYSGDTGMLKLNQAVKIIKIPIAGKPGEFKTGILPVLSSGQTGALQPLATPPPTPLTPASFMERVKKDRKLAMLTAIVVLVILVGSILVLTLSAGGSPNSAHKGSNKATINLGATATANVQATATFSASTILEDGLATNGNGWLIADKNSPDQTSSQFINNAYHMRAFGDTYFGAAVLPSSSQLLAANFKYTLTMQAVAHDNTAVNNYYGMVIRYNEVDRPKPKGPHVTFYALRIYDLQQPKYQFIKVDSDKDNDHLFKVLFEKNTGKEFHGINKTNTITISARGGVYVISVNGTTVGKVSDGEFATGGVGMGVAGNGTEVAFTNLLLTNN